MSHPAQPCPDTMPPCRSLGAAILQRRKELGYTQAMLAERVAAEGDWGFRQSDISRLERGLVTLPGFPRMFSLAAALDIPVGELLARSGWNGADQVFARQHDGVARTAEGAGRPEAQFPGVPAPPSATPELCPCVEIRRLRDELAQMRQILGRLETALTAAESTGCRNASCA